MIGDKPTIFGAQTPVDQGRLRDGDLTYERPRAENRPSSFRHSASWYIVVSRRMPRDLAWKKARARVSRLFLADSPSARPWKIRREPFTSYQYPRNEEHVTGFREFRNNFYHPLVEIDLYCNFKRIILKFSLSDSDPYLSANIFSRSFSFYLSKKWQNSWFKYTFFFFCNVIWEDDNNFSRDGTRVIRTMQILQFLPGCVIL